MNDIILEQGQIEQIKRYAGELEYWNKNVNLISRSDESNILEHHILHSLAILKYINIPKKANCIDIGTGGGFPGIPLAIAKPGISMLLIDSIAKKIKITSMLAKHTELRYISTVCCNAGEIAAKIPGIKPFDIVFSRAVAKIANIIAWTKKLLKENSKIIVLKGGDLSEEIEAAKKMFVSLKIDEIKIQIKGYDWFEQNDKKIIACSF